MNFEFQLNNSRPERSRRIAMASIFNAEMDRFNRNISDILKLKWYNITFYPNAASDNINPYTTLVLKMPVS